MRAEKDLWDLIFFLSDVSSNKSETEIFIAGYVSDSFFSLQRKTILSLGTTVQRNGLLRQKRIPSTQSCTLIYYAS